MEYNLNYINVKFALINAFLIEAESDILDISYNQKETLIDIQIVLLKDKVLSEETNNRIKKYLPEFELTLKLIYISKGQFNENKGEWVPRYYSWLHNVLFCKAEIL